MVRKIKFGLNMPAKKGIGTMQELKEYFDLESILEYYFNGKLCRWLRDRDYNEEAAQLEQLDKEKPDFKEALCKVFDVEYKANAAEEVTATEIEQLVEKRKLLRQYTDDENILEHAEQVVFSQKELKEALKGDEQQTIYLCGDKFTIPVGRKNKTYIGVNMPEVEILSVTAQDLDKLNIKFKNIKLGDESESKIELAKAEEKFITNSTKRKILQYKPSAGFDFMLNNKQRKQSEKLSDCVQKELSDYEFDPDIKSKELLKVIEQSNLNGYLEKFLNRLA